MQLDNYRLYLENTAKAYSRKEKKYLVNLFLNEGVAEKNVEMSGQINLNGEEIIELTDQDIEEQFLLCIKKSEKARRLFESWEFEKDYKYSVIFLTDEFDVFLAKVLKLEPLKNCCENNFVFDSFVKPVAFHSEDYSYLKYNLKFAAIHPITQDEFLLKYPFLVVLHKHEKVVEFRFDVVKQLYLSGKKETSIYVDLISTMKKYLSQNFGCALKALDLSFIVNVSKSDDSVRLIAQSMKTPGGGKAQLEVGNNQEYVLPVIGELKSLMLEKQAELEKVPSVREALEQFMYEMEEMSDYPWIELLWENEIKTRSNHVKFIFDYMGKDYCLLQYYYSNLIGMERMNNVVKYIISHRNDIKTTI